MELLKSVSPSLITIIGIIIGWYLKDKSEKLRIQKENLTEKKRENYLKILNPLIRVLVGVKNKGESDKAIKDLRSFDYNKIAFELMLFGSDSVVSAYNDYFQYIYQNVDGLNPKITFSLLGKILLEIRKDLGNSKTKLKELDMLRFMIKDIDKIN